MAKVFDAAILILYPIIVVIGLNTIGVRWTALALLLLLGRRVVGMILVNRAGSRIILYQAILMVTIMGVAAASKSPFALRIATFVISLTFLSLFTISLRSMPIIERFARLQKPELADEEVLYCRKLTKVWIVLLMANSCLMAAAAFVEDHTLWTILVGPVSYTFLGMVFVVEYPYRKWRFQDFNDKNLVDRFLKTMLAK